MSRWLMLSNKPSMFLLRVGNAERSKLAIGPARHFADKMALDFVDKENPSCSKTAEGQKEQSDET